MKPIEHTGQQCVFTYRVRYAETDQMGTFYNARALEWFEVGRSELSRKMGVPYGEWENRGIFLPLVEAHVKYRGRARYDDELEMTVSAFRLGAVRIQFSNTVVHVKSRKPVCEGFTIHALVNEDGALVRDPEWLKGLIEEA